MNLRNLQEAVAAIAHPETAAYTNEQGTWFPRPNSKKLTKKSTDIQPF